MTNASFVYYRSSDYGKTLHERKLSDLLELETDKPIALNPRINSIKYLDYFLIGTFCFNLKTTYPGLIVGSGYNHPSAETMTGRKDEKNPDFQLGFYFDHTTGMPVIPSSSVKGILKSVFPRDGDNDNVKEEKMKYINNELIKAVLKINDLELVDKKEDNNDWRRLFEKGNIFYDAFISGAPSSGKIFAEDYITPHHPEDKKMGIFKNPIPIRFLKIAPDVTFTFQFKLKDSCFENNQKITPNEKLELFKKILLDFGIGAKRNVGYGNLIPA